MGKAIMIPNVSFKDTGLGKVTLIGNIPITSMFIDGRDNVHNSSDTEQYSIIYTPINTTKRAVIWSIDEGEEYATIGQSGLLQVLEGADNSTVVIKAVSEEDPSVYSTKTITVTYTGVHSLVELSYIAADGGKHINTGIMAATDLTITADFKIPHIEINNTTDRQYVYYGETVACSYSLRWNAFGLNFYNKGNTLASFFNRGVSVASNNSVTLFDKENNVYINMTQGTLTPAAAQNILLFKTTSTTNTFKKTMVYEFDISRDGSSILHLKPYLYDGVPCYFDSISDTFIYLSGDSGNIWYATMEEPNNEILYTQS